MNRRHFLTTLAALPAAGLAGRLFAAPASSPRFLLVFLRLTGRRTAQAWARTHRGLRAALTSLVEERAEPGERR